MSEDHTAAFEVWLDAAVSLGVGFRISGQPQHFWAAHYHLIVLARTQFAVELSFSRLLDAHDRRCSGSNYESLTASVEVFAEIHTFLVSAHCYWRTLNALKSVLVLDDLLGSVSRLDESIANTKRARNHLVRTFFPQSR